MATRIIPISMPEFASMMRRAMPPPGWSETLAVANSGGPDSTCLLFLLDRHLKARHEVTPIGRTPKRLVSLSIDHDLQPSSATMAKHAANIAESLGVEHVTAKLPWGQGVCPPKPGPDDKIEEQARDMRQMVLFECMKRLKANALASGHHTDDQVETMLMRLGRGSRQLGLSGMRACRRWGMGSGKEGNDELYAIEGMRKWIVRPLLDVGKDRILATCEEEKLEYVSDPTNFQPQLTIRNAIRHVIKNGGATGLTSDDPSFSDLPHIIAQQMAVINVTASQEISYDFNLGSDLQHLRSISKGMVTARLDIDNAVDKLIEKYRIPSPPGTFMISPSSLKAIESQVLREALLYRITRYVSPEPWGNPRSELGRRKASVNRLITHLCDVHSLASKTNDSLCVGSSVWWRLVAVLGNRLRTTVKGLDTQKMAWLALRQPNQRSRENNKAGKNGLDTLHSEVTDQIIQIREAWLSQKASKTMELLFDRRFLIRFHVDKIPLDILESLSAGDRIIVEPTKPWTLPRVIHLHEGVSTTLHTEIVPLPPFRNRELGSRKKHEDVKSDWITIESWRPLSAI
ncbi:PP-loop family-domain-containing protein [Flammula alnicola]|nr:PP-loop family-domain-containing protein [Flammula alnicola]